ncbi:hypothetical protein [Archaeoglobus veneficus]|nr:hypothetical protein [Archaeoglobus veneficus]
MKVSEIYRKYTKEELFRHYMDTVGKNFNPVPEFLDLEKVKEKLGV